MYIDAEGTISRIANALELPLSTFIDLDFKADEKFTFRVEIDDDQVREALNDDPDTLSDHLDQSTVMDLAAAIRRGDTKESESLLDRLFAEDRAVTEWIQQGRFSRKARPQLALSEGLRAAA